MFILVMQDIQIVFILQQSGQVPYNFNLPFIQEGMASVGIKVVDNNGCIVESNVVI
jgi:hypothetical protein